MWSDESFGKRADKILIPAVFVGCAISAPLAMRQGRREKYDPCKSDDTVYGQQRQCGTYAGYYG